MFDPAAQDDADAVELWQAAVSVIPGGSLVSWWVTRRPVVAHVRAAAMFQRVVEQLSMSEEEVIRLLESEPRLQRLAWVAADHAARSATEAKVRTFGRVLAAAIEDDANLDPAELLVATLGQLEVIHVRALSARRAHAIEHDPEEEGSGVDIDDLLGVSQALGERIATDPRLALVYSDGMSFRTIVQKIKIAPLGVDLLRYVEETDIA